MNWTVPVFFMITGMLFLRTEIYIDAKDWVFKYARRILLALFIFGIPYAGLKIVMLDGLSVTLLFESILAVVSKTGIGHLWYLYVLISLYLIMPILKRFCDMASDSEMKLVLIALFFLNFCFPLVSELTVYKISFPSQILYPVFYVIMGHWVFENKARLNCKMLWLVTLLCVLLIWILNVIGFNHEAWTSYDSPLIVVLACSVFALFVNRKWKDKSWLWNIDRLCFGAYLIHPLFIQFTYRFLKVTPIDFAIYPVMTVLYAIVFIGLAFMTSWIMRKIGILRKYVL